MSKKIRIAILGLGDVGETFVTHLLEKIQVGKKPVEIVAVADPDPESPVALGFIQNNVPMFTDYLEVARLGDQVDVIFDLTDDPQMYQKMRLELLEHKNRHTVIASEDIARLLWYFFDEPGDLPGK